MQHSGSLLAEAASHLLADQELVVRLVYDGPPRSGKTTSLRALAGSLARPHLTLDEAEGRTLYFDWVEYVGGSFDGRPIRCQIVSVPGQQELAARREALLATADAVIFVADTTGDGIAEAAASLRSLHAFLARRPGPPAGLILQANKRDAPDALPLEAFRTRLGDGDMAVVESVATRGVGIRETFVFAVRLALDRVREQLASGARAEELARADTPEELRRRLDAVAPDLAGEAPAALLLREILTREEPLRTSPASAATSDDGELGRPPCLPASDVPTGYVWPPVSGRLILHEAAAGAAAPHLGPDGSWRAHSGSCFFHSAREHCFHDLDAARGELLRWASLYGNAAGRLSPRRCIVLADTGSGSWRLWQLVHHEPSLRQQLWAALQGADAAALTDALLATAANLLAAREILREEPALPCRLELIGRVPPSLVYVGILPPLSWRQDGEELTMDSAALLRRELLPILQKGLDAGRIDVARVQAGLAAGSDGALPDLLAAILREAHSP